MNQCDGCRRGMPIKNGMHYNPDGSYDYIMCTKHKYEAEPKKVLDDSDVRYGD